MNRGLILLRIAVLIIFGSFFLPSDFSRHENFPMAPQKIEIQTTKPISFKDFLNELKLGNSQSIKIRRDGQEAMYLTTLINSSGTNPFRDGLEFLAPIEAKLIESKYTHRAFRNLTFKPLYQNEYAVINSDPIPAIVAGTLYQENRIFSVNYFISQVSFNKENLGLFLIKSEDLSASEHVGSLFKPKNRLNEKIRYEQMKEELIERRDAPGRVREYPEIFDFLKNVPDLLLTAFIADSDGLLDFENFDVLQKTNGGQYIYPNDLDFAFQACRRINVSSFFIPHLLSDMRVEFNSELYQLVENLQNNQERLKSFGPRASALYNEQMMRLQQLCEENAELQVINSRICNREFQTRAQSAFVESLQCSQRFAIRMAVSMIKLLK